MNKGTLKKLKAELAETKVHLQRCADERAKYSSLQTRIAQGEHKELLERLSALDMKRIVQPSKDVDAEIEEVEKALAHYRETPEEIQRKSKLLAELFTELSAKRDRIQKEITLLFADAYKVDALAPDKEMLLDYVAQKLYGAHKRGMVNTSNLDYILTYGLFDHRPEETHPAKSLEQRWKALDEKIEAELLA